MTTHDQSHHDVIVAWLDNAYENEKRLLPALEEHANEAGEYPEWRERLQQAAEDCRRHIELIRKCIDLKAGKVPFIKGGIEAFTGWAESVGTMEFPDELIRNLVNDLGVAQSGAALYKALVAAAVHNGDQEIADTCRIIQREKEGLSHWLYESIDRATDVLLHKDSPKH